jgi:hypothetical protein
MAAEALRRLFLKPGADHHHSFVEELTRGGKLALMLEEKKTKDKEKTESYVFKLFRLEGGNKLVELEGVKLRIEKVGEGIIYSLEFDDIERWQGFFRPELEAGVKAAEEVEGRLPVEDLFTYMAGWVGSDVAITRNKKGERELRTTTSHLWQLAETHALFDWPYVTVFRVNLTLEGPKPQYRTHASLDKLDKAIRRSAEVGWLKMLGIKAESWEGLKEWVVKNWDVIVEAAAKRLGEEVRSELEALRDKLNDDKTAREAIAPALLLIQAERLGVNETTLKHFAAVASGAIGGDGYASAAMKEVKLASGKRAVALLWATVLAAYGIEAEVRDGRGFDVAASGVGAARMASLYFLYGPPLLEGDDRLKSHKLAEAVRLGVEGLSVSWEGLRRAEGGLVAADLTISEGGVAVKYNVYLRDAIVLQFQSTDRSRVELAARLLRLAGVSAEVKKVGDGGIWHVYAYTDKLATGDEKLKDALANIVREAIARGWVNAGKAEFWLEKLEKGRVLKESWPKYEVRLVRSGALMVRFSSPNPDSIAREAQRLKEMGLEEGRHYTVKMPEGNKRGYVYILREGLAYAAWLSVHGSGERQRLAAGFVEYILQRAEKAGRKVYEKAKEIVEEGRARGSLTLKSFKKEVKVDGRRHVVKVVGWGAEFDKSGGGEPLLRIRITAEVDGVRNGYTITYSRRSKDNAVVGRAYARADAPGGREADAERFSALIKALTGKEQKVHHLKDGRIKIG